jgi:hypothetical protein
MTIQKADGKPIFIKKDFFISVAPFNVFVWLGSEETT